jgi:hypothetical protein
MTMIQLQLTNEEAQHLKEGVKTHLAELDHEIAHTDTIDSKDMLKSCRGSVREFLEKLLDVEAVVA